MGSAPRISTSPVPAGQRRPDAICLVTESALAYGGEGGKGPWTFPQTGGETNLDNLVLLCRRHDRSVHEEGFTPKRLADGEIRFFRPDGPEIPIAPPLPSPGADPLKALATRAVEDGVSIDD